MMLKDITFGQFYQANSFIHKADARIKIVVLIVQMVIIFVARNFISLGLILFALIFEMILSSVPFRFYLKNLKAILPILIFTVILNLFYTSGSDIIVRFWIFTITKEAIFRSIFLMLRIIILIISGSLLTYTTSPNDLTDAIERLLSPLKIIGLKNSIHTLAMMMTIALRFIPTLVDETQKIINAQKARGADFDSGNLKNRINAIIPILIPLLISAVRRAYELAEAMECRCYNGCEGRIRMKQFRLTFRDLIAGLFIVFLSGTVIAANIFLKSMFWSI